MAVLTWVLLGLLIVGAGAFIALPLRRRRLFARPDEEKPMATAEKEAALQLLRDLEQDRQTGKLEDDEYEEQREDAEARAILAMKKLEALGGAGDADSVEQLIRRERTRLQKEARG